MGQCLAPPPKLGFQTFAAILIVTVKLITFSWLTGTESSRHRIFLPTVWSTSSWSWVGATGKMIFLLQGLSYPCFFLLQGPVTRELSEFSLIYSPASAISLAEGSTFLRASDFELSHSFVSILPLSAPFPLWAETLAKSQGFQQ